jgi:Domain of unknown function (DUF4351)
MELVLLSAIEHAQSVDKTRTVRSISAAILASAALDSERSRLYLDLILIFFAKNAPQALEAAMNSLGYEYQSDFARRYFFEGKAEGKAEVRLELILKQLTLRFGPLPAAAQSQVRGAQDGQLETLVERVLTAQTLEEALALLS